MDRTWIYRAIAIVTGVLIIDQAAKIFVFTNMHRGQSIALLGDWLRFTYTENPGMAFGLQFGPPSMITIFSLIATFLIIFYLVRVGNMYMPYSLSLSFVVGGALGNLIDRVFYGRLLYDDPYFLGRVVDFIHVNVWRGYVPDGIPLIGGSYVALFPIWNVADMAIVCGVVGILVFQGRFHQILENRTLGGDSDGDVEVAAEAADADSTGDVQASDDSDGIERTSAPMPEDLTGGVNMLKRDADGEGDHTRQK